MQDSLAALSSFERAERTAALKQLLEQCGDRPAEKPWVNMHMHTFFSFNGEGHSPTRLAWEAHKAGLYAMAICDFDVLDGLDELFEAADLLQLRAAVGFESRVFFSEYAEHDINSPGEPGVFYFMGMGFAMRPEAGTAAAAVFDDMLARSHQRNRALIDRINSGLGDVALDYEADVLPMTPAGNATERHIVAAYHEKAIARAGGDLARAADDWAGKLGLAPAEVRAAIPNTNAFLNTLRSKLMKRGGPGYVQPTRETFPLLDDVIGMVRQCEAIPMSTWLDGISTGEADPHSQLECLVAKGVEAVNVIPDRNWNLKDAEERARKVSELHRYVGAADALGLPVNVGTELNKPGQRFVDDFDADPMAGLAPTFMRGAQVMIGHTRLLRYAGVSYIGQAAATEFPTRGDRNRFFASVGALPAPADDTRHRLEEMGPEQAYVCMVDAARRQAWT